MDYSALFQRAWEIVRSHLFLLGLGVLAALGGASGGGNASFQFRGGGEGQPQPQPGFEGFENWFSGIPVALLLFLACIGLVIAVIFWVISTLARGALVAGVDQIERGEPTGFSLAWGAAWRRVGPLLGIAILPAIPLLILVVPALFGGIFLAIAAQSGRDVMTPALAGFGALFGLMACIAIPFALVLSLLQWFAERASMLEGLGVVESYRRGYAVLRQNLGPALILFLLQVAIGLVLAALLFGPTLVMALCFLLWPVLILLNGAITAYFSTLWTLAWRSWTGSQPRQVIDPLPPGV